MTRASLLIALTSLTILPSAASASSAPAPPPTADATVAAAQRLGVGADAERIRRRLLPGTRLVARGTTSPLGGARLGGSADLPRGAAWPTCHRGHRLTPLAQLDLRALNGAIPGATRATGTLAVFTSMVVDPTTGFPEIDPWFGRLTGRSCYQVRYTSRSTPLTRRTIPRGITAFPSTPITLRPTLTVPAASLVQGWLGHEVGDAWTKLAARAAAGDLSRQAPEAPLRQALGWSAPIQRDPTPSADCTNKHPVKGPWRLLLQLGADRKRLNFDAATGGTLLITIAASDLRAGRFDRLCTEYQLDD
jgi:hypothetical protein